MKISVVGLGKLGGVMAALYASKGFEVVCIDLNQELVNAYKRGECPIEETGFAELLASARHNMVFTADLNAVKDTDAIYIIVPTPSQKNGAFTNKYILKAIKGMAKGIKESKYQIVVITSTVMPNSCAKRIAPAIERYTKKKVGSEIGLCYSPEFIALGNVINGMDKPDAVLIGESDKQAGDLLESLYKVQCSNNPPIHRMTWWNAEASKLSLNVFLTLKIGYANQVARITEKLPTGNIDTVMRFVGEDTRVGKKFLQAGVGCAGECLPRDCKAFSSLAKKLNAKSILPKASDRLNADQAKYIADKACNIAGDKEVITVLGVTFKNSTPVITESRAILIIKRLVAKGKQVRIFDPMGMSNAQAVLKDDSITWCKDIETALDGSDLCIIATAWDVFRCINREFNVMRNKEVLDCWRILDRTRVEEMGVKYHAVGVN